MPHTVVVIIILYDETEYLSKHFCYTQKYDCLQEQGNWETSAPATLSSIFLIYFFNQSFLTLHANPSSLSLLATYQIFFTWKNNNNH